MPIIGLTTQAPRFPMMGKLRKGGPKKKIISKKSGKEVEIQGNDLDCFRYTSDTHPESVEAFDYLFSKPQSITVLLPYSTVEENFEAWMESWQSSRLLHRCDGEYVSMIYNASQKGYAHPLPNSVPCPGKCKQVGRLSVIIPELLRAGHVGTVTLETHSKWDIMGIHESLSSCYDMRGNLQGIEFVLYRFQREISTPEHGRQMKWLVGIKPNHEWIVAQFGAQVQAALPSGGGSEVLQIKGETNITPANNIEDGDFEEVPAMQKVNLKSFHAAGNGLFNGDWERMRVKIVQQFGDKSMASSKELSQEQADNAIKAMAEKTKAIQAVWALDEVLFNGDLNAHLEDMQITRPLYKLPTADIVALCNRLKGSDTGNDEPVQNEFLAEDTVKAVRKVLTGAHV